MNNELENYWHTEFGNLLKIEEEGIYAINNGKERLIFCSGNEPIKIKDSEGNEVLIPFFTEYKIDLDKVTIKCKGGIVVTFERRTK